MTSNSCITFHHRTTLLSRIVTNAPHKATSISRQLLQKRRAQLQNNNNNPQPPLRVRPNPNSSRIFLRLTSALPRRTWSDTPNGPSYIILPTGFRPWGPHSITTSGLQMTDDLTESHTPPASQPARQHRESKALPFERLEGSTASAYGVREAGFRTDRRCVRAVQCSACAYTNA
ncbi:hypothetical protein P280DRAFT_41833 [Massarina eburnea CBS 473.64]|uniref:Uncharacterized protein n=1 Tax=Massarina eburnea CBS 473.64 TaxID=1395130 RepID=A0A6A6S073_9PLEO|nr:hypothetical protein P280DRAFT_41833 [Massarina eburnea CBS 473.64]